MGYNDFHKGFVNRSQQQISKPIMKPKFGVRSVEEIIESRYQKRDKEEKKVEEVKEAKQIHTDYQQKIRAQKNLRNLDK